MKALLLAALGMGLAVPAAAQSVSRSGTTAGAFLQMGVGPRAEALGGAVTAGVSDATALYWNPAGLAQMTTGEAVSAHSDRFGDLTHDYVGVAVPLWGGVAGASVTRLGVPAQEVRTELDQDGTGETFDASSLALGLTYGRAITDRFSLGGTVKLVQERIWHSSASAVAVDLGTQFRTDFFGGLTIGAQLSNFGTDMRLDGRDLRTSVDPAPGQDGNNGQIPADYALDAWSLPLDFKLGVVARPVRSALNQLTIAVDALHPSTNYESLNVGAEYGFRERFFLRGGFQGLFLDESEGGLSLGVGVHQPLPYPDGMAKLDVAYRDAGRLGRIQTIGLSITF
ncbi:MAG TPA: PorV/PorQ family protein [Rubricoccaceae bacterium]